MPFFPCKLGLVLLGLGLLSCASVLPIDPNDPLAVNENVHIDRDPFKGTLFYEGPTVTNDLSDWTDAREIEKISLQAKTEKGHSTRFFLRVIDYYDGDWRGFDQAFDNEGRKFHALAVRHSVDCKIECGFDEIIEIELDRDYL